MMQLCVLSGFCPSSPIYYLAIINLFKQINVPSSKKCILWLIIFVVVGGVFSLGFILELFVDLNMFTCLIASEKCIIVITTSRN